MNFDGLTEKEIKHWFDTRKVPSRLRSAAKAPARKKDPAKKATARPARKKASAKKKTKVPIHKPAKSAPAPRKSRGRGAEVKHSGLRHDLKVGERRRGAAGVWLEGGLLEKTGFSVGDSIRVEIDEVARQVTIQLDPAGGRSVSTHRGRALIEVASKALKRALGSADRVVVEMGHGRLVLHPKEAESRAELRLKDRSGLVGSAFTGAGFMDLAAGQAGYESAFGVEVEPKFAAMFKANNPHSLIVNRPIERALDLHHKKTQSGYGPLLRNVELLVMGIPCDPWSKSRDKAKVPAREHPLYSMTYYALSLIEATNPLNVVIEQVPGYVKDPVFQVVLKPILEAKGYHVTSKVVDSSELGYATGRPRAYVVATTQKGFSWQKALRRKAGLAKVRDVLLPPNHPAITGSIAAQGNWFSTKDKSGIGASMRRLWKREGQKTTFIDSKSKKIGTIVAGYYGWEARGPYVKHPVRKDTYRLLTIEEIKRAHGVPSDYKLPGSPTAQSEALGQGVVVPLVKGIIRALPGGVGSRTITTTGRRLMNPFAVVPLYYGPGAGYSNLPWGWLR